MQPLFVGISGPSCSGKTLLASQVKEETAGRETAIISIDSYYRDLSTIPFREREKVNFDAPEAIDFELLLSQVIDLAGGKEIVLPVYDFRSHTRKTKVEGRRLRFSAENGARPVLIIEGLHVCGDQCIRELIDFFVWIDLDTETCLDRRIKRDTARRGRTPDEVRRRFEKTVVRMYNKYVLPYKIKADLIVSGDDPVAESARIVAGSLEKII